MKCHMSSPFIYVIVNIGLININIGLVNISIGLVNINIGLVNISWLISTLV